MGERNGFENWHLEAKAIVVIAYHKFLSLYIYFGAYTLISVPGNDL